MAHNTCCVYCFLAFLVGYKMATPSFHAFLVGYKKNSHEDGQVAIRLQTICNVYNNYHSG